MTQEHPITPPPELRRLWAQQAQRINPHDPVEWMQCVSKKAAQWGSDQELDACCEWLQQKGFAFVDEIRVARRPKPPSLKERALEELNLTADPNGAELSRTQVELIRRALEQLPDHE